MDLYGLGNILLFTAGKGIYNLQNLGRASSGEIQNSVSLEPEDLSLFFSGRVMNLRKLFPFVPESLNRVLMRFSRKVQVLYGDVDEIIADLEECGRELSVERADGPGTGPNPGRQGSGRDTDRNSEEQAEDREVER